MTRFRLSTKARADIRQIWATVARDRPASADALVESFFERFRLAAMNPEMGEARSDIKKGLRILTAGKYIIGFRRISQGVSIARVIHSARNWESMF